MTKEGTHVAFPVMTLALRGSPSANKLWVLVGGGGGPSKTGIPNELVRLDSERQQLIWQGSSGLAPSGHCDAQGDRALQAQDG